MPFQLLHHHNGGSPFDIFGFFPNNFKEIEKPPIIVFLHGSGERGHNPEQPIHGLRSIFEELQLQAVLLFPQCDPEHRAFYGAMEHRAVHSVVKAMEHYNADPNRIYLVGYSMGGSSILWLAARYPGKVAASVCIAPGITWLGSEPPPHFPMEGRQMFDDMFVSENRPANIARQIQDIPTWFLQGTLDEPCPIAETRLVIDELRKLGRQPKVTEYDGVGHDTLEMSLKVPGLFEWLLEHKTTGN